MQESAYKICEGPPLFLNAEAVAKVPGIAPSNGYELTHEVDFPVPKVGNGMVVPKAKFIQWAVGRPQFQNRDTKGKMSGSLGQG